MSIAVQLLIGQNPEPFLPYAIRSVMWADYFTVVNTALPHNENGRENERIIFDEIPIEKLRYDELMEIDENGHFSFAEARNTALGMTNSDDMVLILDADDVHYPIWEKIVREAVEGGADSITAHFYHLMVYKNLFQYVQPREIVYKNYEGTEWGRGVHEQLINQKRWPIVSDYHYMHYGYVKPQREVFNRWKFYSDLEGDYHHYDGQDPETIIEDRISVCKLVPVEHPPVIQDFISTFPDYNPEALRENRETVPVEKVGLILLVHNDEEWLPDCLKSLALTHTYPQFEVLAIDLASTDKSLEYLNAYKELIEMQVFETDSLLSLTECLNFGLDHFRVRHDIQYIGWIHPDMRFDDPSWLTNLWKELQDHPKIGKICAANTNYSIVDDLISGHEQCYIIRKDIVNKVGLFDENFVGIGGYEDWDYNRRILNHDGYKIMTTNKARVWHKGMGTREKRDTTQEQIANGQYYESKWGDIKCPV